MGKLIALEGLDGAGKTSVINGVVDVLSKMQHKAVVAQTHGGYLDYWKSYETVRQYLSGSNKPILEQEDQILRAAEFIHYASNILPSVIAENDFVFTDRYVLGKLVLAKTLSESNSSAVEMLQAAKDTGLIPQPDFTIFLDVPAAEAHQRIIYRGSPIEVKESISMLRKAERIFALNAVDIFHGGVHNIDGTQKLSNVIKNVTNLIL